MKKLASLTACLFLAMSTFGQSSSELQAKIKADVDARAYLAAIEDLQELHAKDKKVFEANNYGYLLGRLTERTGDFALAMSAYQSTASGASLLAPNAKWHMSQIARSTGNLTLERILLQELIAAAPTSLFISAARNRIARSFYESANYNDAIKLLSGPVLPALASLQKPADNGLARENQILLADAYMRSNRPNDARDAYNKLLNEMPNPAQPDDFALAAVKALDRMDVGTDKFGKSVATSQDTEHLRRATVYQFNRDFSDARLHYQSIIDNYPQSGIVPDALFQTGRGFMQQGNYSEALTWFDRVLQQFPEHPVAKDAMLQTASCYSRTAKFKEAIDQYQKFIAKFPTDDRLDRAYLNIVDVYRDQDDQPAALKAAIVTEQAFKGKPPEALAVFDEARIYLALSDWTNALATFDRLKNYSDLGGIKVPGGTYPAEVSFLRGFTLEQLGRFDEAFDSYAAIPDGRSEYYGSRATERLLSLAGNDAAKPAIARKAAALQASAGSKDPEIKRKALQSQLRITTAVDGRSKLLDQLKTVYNELPAYRNIPSFKFIEPERSVSDTATNVDDHTRIANDLLFLGLYDEAGPEYEASLATPDAAKTGDSGYTLANIYQRGDIANRAVAFIEPLWRNVPADYQIELIPRGQLEMLYPTPYVESLIKSGQPRGVDPRFVLSITRQESRYRASVKSNAAARGLMQFISDTSNKIADELGQKNFDQDQLYDPATAILFGSQYLADLFKVFPAQPPAVAASYNGGDDNMKRWLARSKSDLQDRYVPEVIFSQSKDYVYKVMANYRIYQMMYDENLKKK